MEIGENYFTLIMILHQAGENHSEYFSLYVSLMTIFCDYFKATKRKFLEPEGLPEISLGNTALFLFQKNCR